MTTDENAPTDGIAATPAPFTSIAARPVGAASAKVAPATSRKNLLVWSGICLAILLMTVGTVTAFYIRHSVDACISQITKGNSNAHRNQAVATANVRQERRPANYDKGAGQHTDGEKPTKIPCRWPGADANTVISLASLDYAFFGFLATLLFGTIGVVGIYLTFSLARDELRRIRS